MCYSYALHVFNGFPISAGFSALESCETGILLSVTVLSVYVCFTNK